MAHFAGIHGAHAAQQAAAAAREEEEELTPYSAEELDADWQFKIMRSLTGGFKKPEALAALAEFEAIAGWQLLEQFDKNRVRFKRPVRAQTRDHLLPLGVDAYRTHYGITEGQLAFRIITVLAVCIAIAVVAVITIKSGKLPF